VEVEVRPESGDRPARRLTAEATEDAGGTGKVVLEGLLARTPYRYVVRWRGEEVAGRFVTAPAAADPAPVTLHWSGDLGGSGRCRLPGEGYPVFRAMAARPADLFLFVGDTIYADSRCPAPGNEPGSDFVATSLAGFRRKHRYNREDPALQAYVRRTTVEAIWDDHDVANDFDAAAPLMPVGRRAFLESWPILPPAEEPGRLYRRLRWGALLEAFVLDTRQYRSDNARADGPEKTMLGAAQRAWLVAGAASSDARWKVVVSSVPLSMPTGRAARDSWARLDLGAAAAGRPTGFEHELLVILDALRRGGVRNLVWLTADVHHAAALRHEPWPGFVLHELAAGPLRAGLARPGPLSPTLRPRRLYGDGGFDGFGELAVSSAGATVRLLDAEGRVRFETTLAATP
jgi:alkaline phosphatase D